MRYYKISAIPRPLGSEQVPQILFPIAFGVSKDNRMVYGCYSNEDVEYALMKFNCIIVEPGRVFDNMQDWEDRESKD